MIDIISSIRALDPNADVSVNAEDVKPNYLARW